jgi:hypothetical protein
MARTANGRRAPVEVIQSQILVIRGYRVMLDSDLAALYGVETRVLNQAVKRNAARFPKDFLFRLTAAEVEALPASRSQSVILKRGQNRKYLPYVVTEHGAVMLANVRRSPTAIRASIQVVRAFVHQRQTLALSDEISRKLHLIGQKLGQHDTDIQSIFSALRSLLEQREIRPPKRPIGFLPAPRR